MVAAVTTRKYFPRLGDHPQFCLRRRVFPPPGGSSANLETMPSHDSVYSPRVWGSSDLAGCHKIWATVFPPLWGYPDDSRLNWSKFSPLGDHPDSDGEDVRGVPSCGDYPPFVHGLFVFPPLWGIFRRELSVHCVPPYGGFPISVCSLTMCSPTRGDDSMFARAREYFPLRGSSGESWYPSTRFPHEGISLLQKMLIRISPMCGDHPVSEILRRLPSRVFPLFGDFP